jgi:hypothetical protein
MEQAVWHMQTQSTYGTGVAGDGKSAVSFWSTMQSAMGQENRSNLILHTMPIRLSLENLSGLRHRTRETAHLQG